MANHLKFDYSQYFESSNLISATLVSYINDVFEFTNGYTFSTFIDDKKTMTACAFTVSQMGELANRLSPEITETYSNMPWRGVRGLRNRIVHDYEKIDQNVLWHTIEDDLPEFKRNLELILEGES